MMNILLGKNNLKISYHDVLFHNFFLSSKRRKLLSVRLTSLGLDNTAVSFVRAKHL